MKSVKKRVRGIKYLFLYFVICTLVLLFLRNDKLYSCQCIHPETPKKGLQSADVVFDGTVLQGKPVFIRFFLKSGREYKRPQIKFKVEKVWKGKLGDTVNIVTGYGAGDCGYIFKEGERYLVYARYEFYASVKKERKRYLKTDICTRTKLLNKAKDDLAELGAWKKPHSKKK